MGELLCVALAATSVALWVALIAIDQRTHHPHSRQAWFWWHWRQNTYHTPEK